METKVAELRPDDCGTRIGDIVIRDNEPQLKIKCRRCSKRAGSDKFHYVNIRVSPSDVGFTIPIGG